MSVYIAPRQRAALPQPAAKAGPVGPGAGPLLTEFPLATILGRQSEQDRMRQYEALGRQVLWVRAAEDVIGSLFASVPWHLEDDAGDTAEPRDMSPVERGAWELISAPMAHVRAGQRLTRAELWTLTSRVRGLCGSAFWLRDQPNAYGVPLAFKFIAPWRMTPVEDEYGNLAEWRLDRTRLSDGIPLALEQVVHFRHSPAATGHFGVGLMESAVLKANITVQVDQHVARVLQSGGRLAGIVSPKAGESISNPDVFRQLEQDFRAITEQPDAALRVNLVRGPVDFTQTAMTMDTMRVIELMQTYGDELLGLWNVPKSMLGLHDRGKGLGASTVTNADDETLWRNALMPRLNSFRESLQGDVLDLFAAEGQAVTLVIDSPTFDDEKPAYEVAQIAAAMPLTNNQRLALVGQDPMPPEVTGESGGPLGDEVWLPYTTVLAFSASTGAKPKAPVDAPLAAFARAASEAPTDRAAAAAGEVQAGKAAIPSEPSRTVSGQGHLAGVASAVRSVRESAERSLTPGIRDAVAAVLSRQRTEIAARLRQSASHVAANRSDTSAWFDARRWDAELSDALRPGLMRAAQSVSVAVSMALPNGLARQPGKALAQTAVDRVMARGAARVTGINATTRERVASLIADALDSGWSIMELAGWIESGSVPDGLPALTGAAAFDSYRAELIARTELMDAYNQAALASYSDAGLEYVQAIDGDGDAECEARNGEVFTLDEADSIEDHPNGTLDWVPVIADPGEYGKAAPLMGVLKAAIAAMGRQPVVNVTMPSVTVPPPVVTVEPAVVNVTVPPRDRVRREVERDAAGRISAITEETD